MINNQPFDFTKVPTYLDNETKQNLRKVFLTINASSPLNLRRLSILLNKPDFPANFQSNYNNNPKFKTYILNLSKDIQGKKDLTYDELIEIYYYLNFKFLATK